MAALGQIPPPRCAIAAGWSSSDSGNMALSLGLLILQHNNVAGGSAGKQRPDQLSGCRLIALRTLIPFQAIG
jgi:hypothetical protein